MLSSFGVSDNKKTEIDPMDLANIKALVWVHRKQTSKNSNSGGDNKSIIEGCCHKII